MLLSSIAPYDLPRPGSWPASRASWSIEPRRAALLVHDMQAYFLRPFDAGEAPLGPLLRNLAMLRAVCARAGVPVLFSLQPGEQSRSERGLLWDLWGPGIVEHPDLAALALDVAGEPATARIEKRRYSAFFETGLAERLAELGRDQLLITGIYAHIGCLATALDGFMRGVQPFLVADASADFSREDHDIALRQVARTCGMVVSTREVVESLEPPSADGHELVPETARQLLDVGCGSGAGALALAERLGARTGVTAIDTRLERIEEAVQRGRHVALDVRFAVADARALPFADGSFDAVRVARPQGELDDARRALRELVRVTRPGGVLLVRGDGAREGLTELLVQAGLAVEHRGPWYVAIKPRERLP